MNDSNISPYQYKSIVKSQPIDAIVPPHHTTHLECVLRGNACGLGLTGVFAYRPMQIVNLIAISPQQATRFEVSLMSMKRVICQHFILRVRGQFTPHITPVTLRLPKRSEVTPLPLYGICFIQDIEFLPCKHGTSVSRLRAKSH